MSQVSTIYQQGREDPDDTRETKGKTVLWTPIRVDDKNLARKLREAMARIDEAKGLRAAANATIVEAKANLEVENIPKEVVSILKKMEEWDASKRAWFDHAYPIARDWLFNDAQQELDV